jgi:hypothetical protein
LHTNYPRGTEGSKKTRDEIIICSFNKHAGKHINYKIKLNRGHRISLPDPPTGFKEIVINIIDYHPYRAFIQQGLNEIHAFRAKTSLLQHFEQKSPINP